jgi:type IV pilus assembly protein PilC
MAQKQKVYFTYKGVDKKGSKIDGEIEGYNVELVKAQLRTMGINPRTVRKKPKPLFGESQGKITTGDISIFARQLATMMEAGVPLVQAFSIVGNGHENPAMQKVILAIKADIESGLTLAQGLAKFPDQFDELFCNLVEAGEQAGALEDLLVKIAGYKEKTEAIKKKVKGALTYPIAVLVVSAIVTLILLIFVVPQFEAMFKNFGGELPAFTQMVVDLSRWMQEEWYVVIGLIVGTVTGFTQAKKRFPIVGIYLDRIMLKAPIVGNITEKSIIARFARTMSTMFAAGVPLVEAMESVAGATGNYVYTTAVLKMKEEVATGDQLNLSMKRTGLFPNMVVQMVAIGEESGSVDTMLDKVADFFEEEVDVAVESMSSLMEPFIMVVLGVIIGGLVIAMYLPIFKMGETI